MFTGIIEEIGTVQGMETMAGGWRFHIIAHGIANSLRLGSSIALDGVCQTVTQCHKQGFTVECMETSLQKTTLGSLKHGSPVNLERALSVNGRLDGHFVQGHVNGRGNIISMEERGANHYLRIKLPSGLMSACIPEGSITVNGVSLTIAELERETVTISVIPHSWEHTTFQFCHLGNDVNIETDMFARFIEHFFNLQGEDRV